DENKKNRETSAIDVLTHGTTTLIEGFMTKALSSTASEQTKILLRTITEAQTANGIASALRGMSLRKDTSNLLAMTTVPILLISGEQDLIIPLQRSKDMQELARNSTLVTFKQAGHLSNLEQEEQWNQAVLDFFY
ncbi:MAG: alpha/beta hydrolase, partial [Legionella longbeachae]|nr:alpha/beta hydrolase [Legionella longbeachae]